MRPLIRRQPERMVRPVGILGELNAIGSVRVRHEYFSAVGAVGPEDNLAAVRRPARLAHLLRGDAHGHFTGAVRVNYGCADRIGGTWRDAEDSTTRLNRYATVTCTDPLIPSAGAVTVTSPLPTPATSPAELTVAFAEFEVAQLTTRPLSMLPKESVTVAVNCAELPTPIRLEVGVTTTCATRAGPASGPCVSPLPQAPHSSASAAPSLQLVSQWPDSAFERADAERDKARSLTGRCPARGPGRGRRPPRAPEAMRRDRAGPRAGRSRAPLRAGG